MTQSSFFWSKDEILNFAMTCCKEMIKVNHHVDREETQYNTALHLGTASIHSVMKLPNCSLRRWFSVSDDSRLIYWVVTALLIILKTTRRVGNSWFLVWGTQSGWPNNNDQHHIVHLFSSLSFLEQTSYHSFTFTDFNLSLIDKMSINLHAKTTRHSSSSMPFEEEDGSIHCQWI